MTNRRGGNCPLCGSPAPWTGRRFEHWSPNGKRLLYRATVDRVEGDIAKFVDIEHVAGPHPPGGVAVHLLVSPQWRVAVA